MKSQFAIPYQTGAKAPQSPDEPVKSILPVSSSTQEPAKGQK